MANALVDVRAELPVAVKGGTASKPVWEIGGKQYKFVKPLKATGVTVEGKKPRLGKMELAKYKAGVTKTGKDLMFVGVFKHIDG